MSFRIAAFGHATNGLASGKDFVIEGCKKLWHNMGVALPL